MRLIYILAAGLLLSKSAWGQNTPEFSAITTNAIEQRTQLRSYAFNYSERISVFSQRTSGMLVTEQVNSGRISNDDDTGSFCFLTKNVASDFIASDDPTFTSTFPDAFTTKFAMRSLERDYFRHPSINTIGEQAYGSLGAPAMLMPFDIKSFGFGFKADVEHRTPWFECIGFYEDWGSPMASMLNDDGTATYLWGDFELTVDISRGYWPVHHALYGLTNGQPRIRTVQSSFDMELTRVGAQWLPLSARYTSNKSERIIRFEWQSVNQVLDDKEFSRAAIERLVGLPLE